MMAQYEEHLINELLEQNAKLSLERAGALAASSVSTGQFSSFILEICQEIGMEVPDGVPLLDIKDTILDELKKARAQAEVPTTPGEGV